MQDKVQVGKKERHLQTFCQVITITNNDNLAHPIFIIVYVHGLSGLRRENVIE